MSSSKPFPLANASLVGLEHRPGIRALEPEEVRFEIDMCIGCNRCMQACPVPLSSSVSIADLNAATTTPTIPPSIAAFTHDCVMCGLCVPVCPVGDHRDLLMLSLKKRLDVPWDGPVDPLSLLSTLPANWTAEQVLSRVRVQPLVAAATPSVPDQHLWHLLLASRLHVAAPGEVVMREGDFGHSLSCILDGNCSLSSTGPNGTLVPLAILHPGEYLGEQGALTGQSRTATATALSPVLVLEIPEPALHTLMQLHPSVRQFLMRKTHAASLESMLKRMALFQGVAEEDLRHLIGMTHVTYFDRSVQVFAEEDMNRRPPSMYLLLDGFVKVTRGSVRGTHGISERILAYRQGGDYFVAGMDLLGDNRPVAVTTITRTSIVEIPYAVLSPLFSRYPELSQRFQARFERYREAAQAAHTGSVPAIRLPQMPSPEEFARTSLRTLVGDGVVEGTDVLVIDLDRCVHCNECEEACTRRHGHSRMNRTGMVVGNISVVTACRQCQDPVCMLCSRAGIARLPSGEVYITESCIGCGICAERCPYDNIEIVDMAEALPPTTSTWDRFSRFFVQGAGKEYGRKHLPMAGVATPPILDVSKPPTDAYGLMLKKVAVKCDLCAGYGNQACVVACPTGAVLRTNPTTFFGSTEEILSRRG